MIILDTHAWVWWVHGDPRLSPDDIASIDAQSAIGIGIAAISCWEVAKLVEYGRLRLPRPLDEWMGSALAYPGVSQIPMTPDICIESTQLPPPFHRDPADQLIVATARRLGAVLLTADQRILGYPHVQSTRVG